MFVTLEGVDGSGKSTQAALLARALELSGRPVTRLREPGGTAISEKIRALVLDPACSEMSDACELLLYEAARAQLVHEVIRPALAAGRDVVCDRFMDSTTAYQAFADGLPAEAVAAANEVATAGTVPDLTVVLDADPAQAAERRAGRAGSGDRMEAKGDPYQRRVAAGYRAVAAADAGRVRLVDAGRPVAEVFSDVCRLVAGAGAALDPSAVGAALSELGS